MAYNSLDVTTGKGDTLTGPFWYNHTPITEDLTLDFDPATTAGWVRIGEGSTDGVDVAQEADKTDKTVWGAKVVGSTFTNFTDTATVRFASSTDADVLGVVFGRNNVEITGNVVKLNVRNRQPEVGSFVIMSKTDDGRPNWIVAHRAQPDINVTRTFGDEDIVVIETVFTFMQDDSGRTHYELTERAAGSEPVVPDEEDPGL